MKERYEIISMRDHYKIRLGIFEPQRAPKGVVQLIHGFGEYTGHYLYLINDLVNAGFVCLMHDQRGHGILAAARPKMQGRAQNYDKFLSDCLEIRKIISKKYSRLPVYLFGHSLGGNIALNLLLRNPQIQNSYQKAVIESPWLDLAHPPAKIIQSIAQVAGKISPHFRIRTRLKVAGISHHQDLVDLVTKDGIYHDFLSLRLFSQIMEAGRYAQNHAKDLTLPTLLFCGGQDAICSAPAIRRFAQQAGENVIYDELPEAYHALHLDTDARQFLNKMKDFLLKSEFS